MMQSSKEANPPADTESESTTASDGSTSGASASASGVSGAEIAKTDECQAAGTSKNSKSSDKADDPVKSLADEFLDSRLAGPSAKKIKLEVTTKPPPPGAVLDPVKEKIISQLVAARATAVVDPADMPNPPSIEESKTNVDGLMQFGYMELSMIIKWAKLVPGFRQFSIGNQIAVLRSSFMDLNLIRLSYRSLDCPGHIRFAEGIVMPRSECVKMGWTKELIDSTLEFVDKLREIDIDATEFSILNVVVLSAPDAPTVDDRSAVLKFQTDMLDYLGYYCSTRYPAKPRRYLKILLCLSALRELSARAAENFLNLSLQGQVHMNDLVAEMMS